MNTPTLETGRLILRKFSESDLPAFYESYSDPEVNTYLPWFVLTSMEQAKAFYAERYQSVYSRPEGYAYAICLKEDNRPIGYMHLEADSAHDFGYGLRREFWRQGIVSEAGRAVIAQAKKDGCPYLTATHDRNNPHSGYVMQSPGMEYKYSYEELWQPKNIPVIFRMYQLNLDGNNDRVFRKYWNMYENHFVETL